MSRQRLEKGLVQVYTGNSKGKTTASLGLALRAIGHGFKVCMVQFMKGGAYTGELFAAPRLYPNLKILQYGITCPYSSLIRQGDAKCCGCGACFPLLNKEDKNQQKVEKLVRMALTAADEVISSDDFDIVILDEINNMFSYNLVTIEDVKNLLQKKPSQVEVVLTGRNAPPEIIELADLVTEMNLIKHPFQQGISSRRGIEY